ncbi:right-handed parallel beta-helix repeat-containing protein [Fusibacter ferrireducens]|uniref:Right-handed parallel beta-helix repeat-containing protein n=1 Tax=Fusibacter ferrireducens TaxID=2785058 RepID=A0ABR9ZUP8_9FIRM|nr:right-handed parallel beta-helix repeat-containing protein [Fusibacter ferrireducens]MBF4694196.1 right-handed parallel beta-helix repeat-containing protein [Fusibacter ferrireducens]
MNKKNFSLSIMILYVLLSALSFGVSQAQYTDQNAQILFVSPNGNDLNDGTINQPLASIQHAIDIASPGTTIQLRNGIYYEAFNVNRSGNQADGYIKITPYASEHAIIDGSRINAKVASDELIRIEGQSYIQIEGLEFRNLNLEYARGIYILNGSHDIIISGNTFHDINTTKLEKDNFGGANAITVKSYDEKLRNYNLTIENNHIYDCILGFSEALVLSGNTTDFTIAHNTINHVTNIGIDIAGHYGEYKGNPDTNQARNGLIDSNLLIDCKSDYGSGAASGIYVDGGRDLVVSNNVVTDSDYGITLGCETPGKTVSGVTVTSNVVYKNQKSGIAIGGYKEGLGSVIDCDITLNKTYKNNLAGKSYQSEITLKISENIEITDNIFYSSQTQKPNFSRDKKYYPILYNELPAKNITLANNIYFSSAGMNDTYFRWQDREYIGFTAYKAATNLDLSSKFYDPLFKMPERGDLNLEPFKSPIKLDGSNSDWVENIPFYVSPKELSIFSVTNDMRSLYLIYEPIHSDGIISIYLDTDHSASTGYKTYRWQNAGVDYLIENNILYKYIGNGSDWAFQRIMHTEYAFGDSASEYKVPLSSMDIASGNRIRIGIISKTNFQLPSRLLPMSSFNVQ